MEQSKTLMGRKETKWFESGPMMCNLIYTAMFGKKPIMESYYVDERRIRERKTTEVARGQGGVEFVSTNDVLCSDFGIATRSGALLVSVNLRERLLDLTAADAGNYQGLFVFRADDCAYASLIRKTLQSSPPAYSYSVGGALPGCFKTMCSVRMSELTNWTSFFQELEIEDCEHMIHFPSYCGSSHLILNDFAIVYRPRRGESAMMYWGRSLDRAGLQRELPLGAAVQISTHALANEVIQLAPETLEAAAKTGSNADEATRADASSTDSGIAHNLNITDSLPRRAFNDIGLKGNSMSLTSVAKSQIEPHTVEEASL